MIKSISKAIIKGADDITITLLKKLDAEDIHTAFVKFRQTLQASTEEAVATINVWLKKAENRYKETELAELLSNTNECMDKAVEKAVPLENKASDTLKATFEQGQVFIDVNSPVPGGMRDYTKAKAKSIMVSPFEIIRMNYDGREIKIPALLLLKSWTNSGATPEGLFHNYYKEDLDWNSLGEEERDAYFAEFVAHYLPRGFIEALGSPLQLFITGLITVGLAVTTGGTSVIAQLELALSAAGIALTAASTVGSLQGMMAANKMKEAAGTTREAKKAAKEMAESIAQLSLSAVDLLLAGKGFLQAKSKNVVAVVDSTKKSPEEILQEAGYKRGKEINDYSAKVKELQKYYTNDELIEAINKQKNSKKSAKYILDRMLEKNNTPKIDGLFICDGKVDGKIPVDIYKEYRQKSMHNPESNEMTFGKYDIQRDEITGKPVKDSDGKTVRLPSNYIERAGNTTYFDLGQDWEIQTKEYWLDRRGRQMFKLYNRPAIDDAITSGKQLRFSHDPRKYHDCALEWEWNYIKNKLNIDEFDVDDVLIYREDGFWYVEK